MLDVKFLRENLGLVRQMLKNRRSDLNLEPLLDLDETRRRILVDVEQKKHRRNVASEEISRLKKEKKDASSLVEEMKEVGRQIKVLDEELAEVEHKFRDFLLIIPNIPDSSVPVGSDEKDNKQIRTWGEKPAFDFKPKPHWEIGEGLGILDFERGAKITGARFTLYWGAASALERALICFMIDIHTKRHGYTEVLPPFMVNSTSMRGTGQLPKFKEDLFKIDGWDYWLVPTAEVPVTNIHSEEILEESVLPRYYTAYTPCFRSEAGSHGKDTRGLIRQHQFNKVELVKFTSPEDSYTELEKLLKDAETILQQLGIHYRVVLLCTGDLAFPHQRLTISKCGFPARIHTGKYHLAATLRIFRQGAPISVSAETGETVQTLFIR
jgi:seryl-tRNA synthetase